jgi:hypothetical protein
MPGENRRFSVGEGGKVNTGCTSPDEAEIFAPERQKKKHWSPGVVGSVAVQVLHN